MTAPAVETFAELMAFQRQTQALGQVAERLGWDRETTMPPGAAAQRAEESAALEAVLHARRTDPRLGEWLAALEGAALDPAAAAQVRLIGREHRRSRLVPAPLAEELARVTSLAQGVWAEARAADDFAAFAPMLARVVRLRREEGEALAQDSARDPARDPADGGAGGDPYDALLDGYEPGATQAGLSALFDALRPRLVALCDRVQGAPQPKPLHGHFPEALQLALAREVAGRCGYDFDRGRLDRAVHPFCSGSGQDVRITTRVDEADPFNCLYSTIHESGHAGYEQAIDPEYLLTPVGQGCSMGVHESQSRLYENQLCRSRPFADWLFGRLSALFGPLDLPDPEALHGAVNRVHPGFIRTEADELHYNLHVALRFDLERALIAGELPVDELPLAWDSRFEADFGVRPASAAQGCLQDVHWSAGLFGYFATYTLGNVYAGCLMQALRRDTPQLDAALSRGDLGPATLWLRARLQRFGGLREPRPTIAHACGFEPDPQPLLAYLEAKFAAIYRL